MSTGPVWRAASAFIAAPVSVVPVRRGHINETFAVTARGGQLVLQRINRTVFTDVDGMMANILTVHRHLEGRLVPEPIAAHDGRWLVHDDTGVWRAWHRVARAVPVAAVTPAVAASAGGLLGRFHASLADLDTARLVETIPRFHDPERRLQALRDAIDADAHGRAAVVEHEIELAYAGAPLAALAADLSGRVPRRVAHQDAKLDNVLFRGDDAVCLIDLDTLMPGAWFWDVGDLLRTASCTAREDDPRAVTVDPSCYDAILSGYRQAVSTAAAAAEIEALDAAASVVTYEQAVRFLTDWLDGDRYYRVLRPAQNRDRARAQFRLLTSMPGPLRWS